MSGVPGRGVVLAASWIFVISSALLLLEFVLLNYVNSSLPGWAALVNWSGMLEGIGWFLGFALLVDWIVFSTFPAWGPSRRALAGATLKLIASVLFSIQPFSALTSPGYGVPGLGVPWSNFAGILFFHMGNSIDAIGMWTLFDLRAPFAWSNWPILGMYADTSHKARCRICAPFAQCLQLVGSPQVGLLAGNVVPRCRGYAVLSRSPAAVWPWRCRRYTIHRCGSSCWRSPAARWLIDLRGMGYLPACCQAEPSDG